MEELHELFGIRLAKLTLDRGILVFNFLSDLHHSFSAECGCQDVDFPVIVLCNLAMRKAV